MGLQKKGEILQDHLGSFHAASFLDEKPFAIACTPACYLFAFLHAPFPLRHLSALGRKILRYCKLQRAAIFVRRQTNRSANREEFCAIAREVVAMRLRAEAKVA